MNRDNPQQIADDNSWRHELQDTDGELMESLEMGIPLKWGGSFLQTPPQPVSYYKAIPLNLLRYDPDTRSGERLIVRNAGSYGLLPTRKLFDKIRQLREELNYNVFE